MMSKAQQVAEVVEGLGVGLRELGVDHVSSWKLDLEFAFAHAWRRWHHASDYASVGRAIKPDNEFWIGVTRSGRRRNAVVSWVDVGGRYAITLPEGWSPAEAAEVIGDRPLSQWVDLATPFNDRLSDQT